MWTFALAGRDVTHRFTQGVASLALGYGDHWAFSPLGLSGLCATIDFSARLVNSAIRQSAVRKVLTAYGDGLWGLRERVAGWRITRRGNYCKFCNNCHRWEKL